VLTVDFRGHVIAQFHAQKQLPSRTQGLHEAAGGGHDHEGSLLAAAEVL
jgi:hypothetical protein